ncbi:hypothetical protein U1Q18_050363, partial [Sarracenia purpurea var. burkii]
EEEIEPECLQIARFATVAEKSSQICDSFAAGAGRLESSWFSSIFSCLFRWFYLKSTRRLPGFPGGRTMTPTSSRIAALRSIRR